MENNHYSLHKKQEKEKENVNILLLQEKAERNGALRLSRFLVLKNDKNYPQGGVLAFFDIKTRRARPLQTYFLAVIFVNIFLSLFGCISITCVVTQIK
ncbi:hypothetical protein [Seramator thermalis]|uniref:hypothetical protein n=1 Tax=Seramator thermalis TaxID=2496270 RepID=UPI00101CDD68|nr:hypothetical protein [Seramator thermalis]